MSCLFVLYVMNSNTKWSLVHPFSCTDLTPLNHSIKADFIHKRVICCKVKHCYIFLQVLHPTNIRRYLMSMSICLPSTDTQE